jgi:hypothetical protein
LKRERELGASRGDEPEERIGECQYTADRVLLEAEGVHNAGWDRQHARGGEVENAAIRFGPPAAGLKDENVVEIAVRVRPNDPIRRPASIVQELKVSESVAGGLRRLSVKEEVRDQSLIGRARVRTNNNVLSNFFCALSIDTRGRCAVRLSGEK